MVGKNGLMKRLFKDVMQQLLDAEMEELYGIELFPSAISHITDKVLGAVAEWQNRMLDKVYPIIYMDGVHFKVREDNKIVSKAAYVCLGIDMNGYKDILGIWIGESEGAKFWLGVCNDLNNRGVKDILIAYMDGLRGLLEAIKAVFPNVCIQSCIVHQIGNSLKCISYKDKKNFMKDLKLVYTAETVELALSQLDMLKEKWDYKYANVIDPWYSNWNNLSTFFDFSSDIRKI